MKPEQTSVLIAWLSVMLAMAAHNQWIGTLVGYIQKPATGSTAPAAPATLTPAQQGAVQASASVPGSVFTGSLAGQP